MTQRRYFNFGTPITASDVLSVNSGLTTKGVLKGGFISVSGTTTVSVAPIWVVFPSGMILNDTDPSVLVVPYSSGSRTFTITYRHTDGGLLGGNAALLQVESGFISNDDPVLSNGIALAYINYSGSGALVQGDIAQVPNATIDATLTLGDGEFKLPSQGANFGDGFNYSTISAIVPTSSEVSTTATYVYENMATTGGINFTALTPGTWGNNLVVSFIDDGSVNRLITLAFSPPSTFAVYLAKSSGVISSTMAAISTILNGNTDFNVLATTTPTGITTELIEPRVFNLSGGSYYGLCYKIDNSLGASDVTHNLKWSFVAQKNPPQTVLLDYKQESGSPVITTFVTDTTGNICTLETARKLTQTSGLTRRSVRIKDGVFTPGDRYFVQQSILTKTSNITLIALSGTSQYGFPF